MVVTFLAVSIVVLGVILWAALDDIALADSRIDFLNRRTDHLADRVRSLESNDHKVS